MTRRACSCGATVLMLPTPSGSTMPVDVGRDPHGSLVAVRIPGKGWGVRVLTPAERQSGTITAPRYTPHWVTCPDADQYRAQARRQAPDTWPQRLRVNDTTAGPCARCGAIHPTRYGPGGSPLCPSCRQQPCLRSVASVVPDQSGERTSL